jgi:hypothetical protein
MPRRRVGDGEELTATLGLAGVGHENDTVPPSPQAASAPRVRRAHPALKRRTYANRSDDPKDLC